MVREFLVLECKVEGCDAEFYLNDIPVIRRGSEIGKYFAGPIHQYLVDGVNELAFVVEPGPTPSTALRGGEEGRERRTLEGASVYARLSRYPFGSVTGGPAGVELHRVEWSGGSDEDVRPARFPLVVDGHVDLGPLRGRWAWQDADPLELDDEDVADLTYRLETLQESLEAGNPDPFLEMSRVRIEEHARAYEDAAASKIRLVREVAAHHAAQSWWGMQPVDPECFDLRLCARNRMVQCIAKDWDPILRAKPDDEGGLVTYELFFSRVDGEWVIAR